MSMVFKGQEMGSVLAKDQITHLTRYYYLDDMLYHVSLFPVKEFYPRIPSVRCPGEDDSIPRISFSCYSIVDTLRAVPESGRTLRKMLDAGIEPVIYVYMLPIERCVRVSDPRQPAKGLRLLPVSETERYVPDASMTGECWLLDNVEGSDLYQVTFRIKDICGEEPIIEECVPDMDNLDMVLRRFGCRTTRENLGKFWYPGNENKILSYILDICMENSL